MERKRPSDVCFSGVAAGGTMQSYRTEAGAACTRQTENGGCTDVFPSGCAAGGAVTPPQRSTMLPLGCDGQGVTLYVSIVNASVGGLFVRTQTPFNRGDAVTIRWHFSATPRRTNGVQCFPLVPGDPTTEHCAAAHVVWKREIARPPGIPGMGLKFTEIKEETARILETLSEEKT